jgi:hypothetical protein
MSEDKREGTGMYVYEPGPESYYRIRKPNGKLFLPHNLASSLNSVKYLNFRKHALQDGNVIVVQHPAGMGNPQFEETMQQFADMVYAQTGVDAIVIAVNKLSEITVMDEDRMEKYGWVKKSRVFAFKNELIKDIADKVSQEEEE